MGMAWPQGHCNSVSSSDDFSGYCHNAFGRLPVDQWDSYAGWIVGAASVGAIIAMGLIQAGLFTKDELGIDDQAARLPTEHLTPGYGGKMFSERLRRATRSRAPDARAGSTSRARRAPIRAPRDRGATPRCGRRPSRT